MTMHEAVIKVQKCEAPWLTDCDLCPLNEVIDGHGNMCQAIAAITLRLDWQPERKEVATA